MTLYKRYKEGGPVNNGRKYGPGMISNWWNGMDFSDKEDAEVQKQFNFVNNWYQNRKTITDLNTGKARKVPQITLKDFPNVTREHVGHMANGSYDPDTNEIKIDPSANIEGSQTYLHEYNHAHQRNAPSDLINAPIERVEYGNNKIFNDRLDKKNEADYEYDPHEVHSRLMQFRYQNNLQPEKAYNANDIKRFKGRELLKGFTDDEVLKLLNGTVQAGNKPVTMAKYGGSLYKKYALGGTQDPDNKFGNASAAVAGIGTGLVDAIDAPNEYGHQSAVGTIGKSTLQMGALGAEVGGPLGAGIGAGLGLVSGFLKSRSNSNAENIAKNRMIQSRNTMDRNNSMARIATNPSLVAGYKDAQMFATGGTILPPVVLSAAKEKYRTKLSTQEQPLYNAWKSKLPVNLQWDKDYDLQGLYKENPNAQPSANLHFTDKFKRPNHPTFSDESQYFNDRTKQTAGHWKETPTEWDYVPYDTSVKKPIIEKKATGGELKVHIPGTGEDTNNDTLPSYFNYIKSIQNNNADGATASLNHIRDIRGPQMAARMQFLGKSLGTTNINDIARRGVGGETDPQMKLLYSTINENPDVINKFQYATEMPNTPLLAKHAAGGPIKAPLTAAYMTGGKAVSTSSGTTEIEGNSHDEGGVKAPQLEAELEDGETTSGNFVFSKELGFAKLHAPIAKAKGIIEKKPQTGERIAAIKLLNAQENKLALSQEYLKKQLGIK